MRKWLLYFGNHTF